MKTKEQIILGTHGISAPPYIKVVPPALLCSAYFISQECFRTGFSPWSSVDRVRARRKLAVSRRLTSAGCVHGVAIAVIAYQARAVAVVLAPLEQDHMGLLGMGYGMCGMGAPLPR